jgi:hypothetical protein
MTADKPPAFYPVPHLLHLCTSFTALVVLLLAIQHAFVTFVKLRECNPVSQLSLSPLCSTQLPDCSLGVLSVRFSRSY